MIDYPLLSTLQHVGGHFLDDDVWPFRWMLQVSLDPNGLLKTIGQLTNQRAAINVITVSDFSKSTSNVFDI